MHSYSPWVIPLYWWQTRRSLKHTLHTNDPGLVLQKALTFGSLSRIKIDNMREEHQEKLIKDAEKLAKEQEKEAEEKAKAAAGPEKRHGIYCSFHR